jgi:hypothetical protein
MGNTTARYDALTIASGSHMADMPYAVPLNERRRATGAPRPKGFVAGGLRTDCGGEWDAGDDDGEVEIECGGRGAGGGGAADAVAGVWEWEHVGRVRAARRPVMKAVAIYESMYTNTHQIASAIG